MQLFEQAQQPCTQLLRHACDVIWRPLLVNWHGFALPTCHIPAYPRAQRVVGAHARGVRGRVIWDPRFVERR
jgi:hypothetical protein